MQGCKDLQDLVDGVRERNLKAAGNYLCDVGIVTNYNFELNSTGGYTGTIDVVTQGQNILNQTTQEADSNTGEVMSEIIKNLEIYYETIKHGKYEFGNFYDKNRLFHT